MDSSRYLRLIASSWRYDDPHPVERLQEMLAHLYGEETAGRWRLTLNGRTALYTILKSFDAQPGDEIVIQSFTCVVAVNPIVWAGFTPVFADIDPENLSMSTASLESCISVRTRAIVVQHTFGMPSNIEAIADIARRLGLPLIEDCAHALGMTLDGRILGTFGDAAILSFGIEKVLSSKVGGALLVNDEKMLPRVDRVYRSLPIVSRQDTLRWLLFPLIRIGLRHLPGEASAVVDKALVQLGLLREATAEPELSGKMPPGTPARLSGALAEVVIDQIEGLGSNLSHRQAVVEAYDSELSGSRLLGRCNSHRPMICYPIFCESTAIRDRLKKLLRESGIPVTTWYDPPVYPRGVDLHALNYYPEAVPVAEDLASRVLCLPTGRIISPQHAREIARELIAASADVEGAAQPIP